MKVWGGRTITQLCHFLFCAISHNHISIVHVFAAEGAPTGFVNHTWHTGWREGKRTKLLL